MLPYLYLVFGVYTLTFLGRCYGSKGIARLTLCFAITALILFAGLRGYSVGTDTGNYKRWFDGIHKFSSAFNLGTEIGFSALLGVARSISDSYVFFLLAAATLTVTFYITAIAKMVRHYETAVYVYITLGTYTFLFNGVRQAIAASITFWAIRFVLEKRLFAYVLSVAIAASFHLSALVALPLYFIAGNKLRLSRVVFLVVVAIGLGLLFKFSSGLTLLLFSDHYSAYAEISAGGGGVMSAFLLAQGILLTIIRRMLGHKREKYTILLNIYLISILPVLISTLASLNPSGILRLHIYFSSSAILMWPMAVHSSAKRDRPLIGFTFFCVTMAFFVLTTSAFSDLVPYYINLDIIK